VGYAKEKKEERAPDPVLNLRHARLRAVKVIEKEGTEKEGKTYPPKVSIWWDIVDDKSGGGHSGTRFWDNYSFVKSFDDPSKYVIREGTRIGDLAAFMAYAFEDGADYFNSDVDVAFEDLEDHEVIASIEPRRFKEEAPTGSRTVSTTLMLAEERVTVPPAPKEAEAGAPGVDDIPF
jgi:hypothetical protein